KTMGAAPVTGSAGAPRASARPSTSEAMTSEIPLLIARLLSAGRDDRSPSIPLTFVHARAGFPCPRPLGKNRAEKRERHAPAGAGRGFRKGASEPAAYRGGWSRCGPSSHGAFV